jgi:hypothetical protein
MAEQYGGLKVRRGGFGRPISLSRVERLRRRSGFSWAMPSDVLGWQPHGTRHDARVSDPDADDGAVPPRAPPLHCEGVELLVTGLPSQGYRDGDRVVDVVVHAWRHGPRVQQRPGGADAVHAAGDRVRQRPVSCMS